MKPFPLFAAATGALILSAPLILRAQSAKTTTDVEIQGHVVEPAHLETTAERIANLKMPAGFQIEKFAELQNPRMLAVAPEGTIYISQREPGNLVMLKDTNNDGRADVQKIVAKRKMLHGVAVRGSKLYFVTVKELYVADRKADGSLGTPRLLFNNLPDGGQHPNRTLGFGPDGMLYLTVGSTCNACDETSPESATILRMTPDGKNRKIFASGLRNTIGFGWHPSSKRMFGMDNGIDWLGDNGQKEELNELQAGARYGWPYIYADGKFNPQDDPPAGYTQADWAKMSRNPSLLYTAHSAPLQMAFYTASQFPKEYKNDAFIAMRGSWNRKPPSGYEVARIRFDGAGKPISITPFLSGFLLPNASPNEKPAQFARLAGVAVAKDGALLVGDDSNGVIYRVSYGQANLKRAFSPALDSRKIAVQLLAPKSAQPITIRAGAFAPGGTIPAQYSAYMQNQSPALRWSGVPKNAKSLVIMMEDPDATSPKPFVHWIMANISPKVSALPAKLPMSEKLASLSAMQGSNHTGAIGYFGPKPPAGTGAHAYHFQIFALDKRLNLPSGFNRQALLDAMNGHVLARGEVVGKFQRAV